MNIDWQAIRSHFAVTNNLVYFQSAGISPMPEVVFQTLVEEYQRVYEYGDVSWLEDCEQNYPALCQTLANLINAQQQDITFLANTSTIMSYIALAFQKNHETFNIISMQDEFPSTTVPFEYQNIAVKYVVPQQNRYSIDSILQQIDSNTIAVISSYVQYATGFRQDLQSLGTALKERGIMFIVNATQGFPIFPIDVQKMKIDALTASLHKWGCAGHVGAMFYTSPKFRSQYPCPFAGWMSVDHPELVYTAKNQSFSVTPTAAQYSLGTINFAPLNALHKAIHYLQNIGWENIRERIQDLTSYLRHKLNEIPVEIVSPGRLEERSAITSFRCPGELNDCIEFLKSHKIIVSPRDGNIRVALNIFNTHQEIDYFAKVLKQFITNPRESLHFW